MLNFQEAAAVPYLWLSREHASLFKFIREPGKVHASVAASKHPWHQERHDQTSVFLGTRRRGHAPQVMAQTTTSSVWRAAQLNAGISPEVGHYYSG